MGITGSRPVWNEGILVKSVPDGIGQILLNDFGKKKNKEAPNKITKPSQTFLNDLIVQKKEELSAPECPDCGGRMVMEGGCSICHDCGYSHCG
jgi:ribonucleoside-diphosphate reductase alpha chain